MSNTDEYRYDVFVSYSHLDREWVRDWLLPHLESAGVTVCIDYRDFDVGVPSLENMEHAVDMSRHTVIVLTPTWLESEWTTFEGLLVQTADPVNRKRKLLPLLLQPCGLPRRLSMITYADFTREAERERQLERLLLAIRSSNSTFPHAASANHLGGSEQAQERSALPTTHVPLVYTMAPNWPDLPSALADYPKDQDAVRVIRGVPLGGLVSAPLTKLHSAILRSAIRAVERRTLLLFPRMEENDEPVDRKPTGLTFDDSSKPRRVSRFGTDGGFLVAEEISLSIQDNYQMKPALRLQTELLMGYMAVVFARCYAESVEYAGTMKIRYEIMSNAGRELVEERAFPVPYVWRRTDLGGYPITVERDVPAGASMDVLKSISCDMILEFCSYFGADYSDEQLQSMLDRGILSEGITIPDVMT